MKPLLFKAMAQLDLSVYVVIDPAVCAGRPPEEIAVQAARGGATLLQYRDKSGDEDAALAGAQRVKAALDDAGLSVPLLINDYPSIAQHIGAAGVHIGQGDMTPQAARALLGEAAIIGLTAFTPDHMAALDPAVVDYVGTGPVYPTKTDKGKPILGVEGLARLVALSPVPVVGIGGITPASAAEVMRAGVDGVAVMRAVSAADDPQGAAQALVKIISEGKN